MIRLSANKALAFIAALAAGTPTIAEINRGGAPRATLADRQKNPQPPVAATLQVDNKPATDRLSGDAADASPAPNFARELKTPAPPRDASGTAY